MCELAINDGIIETKKSYGEVNEALHLLEAVKQHPISIEEKKYHSWRVPLQAKFGEEQLREINMLRPRGLALPDNLEGFVDYLGLWGRVEFEECPGLNKVTVDGDIYVILSGRLNEELVAYRKEFLFCPITFCVGPYCSWDQTPDQKGALTRLYRRLERSLGEYAIAI